MGNPRLASTEPSPQARDAEPRACDHPGCSGEGLYRAPRARSALRSYYWFCLDHVRQYNRAWNFYAGMTADEVEASIRADVVGWRPTWPMDAHGPRLARGFHNGFHDGFGFFAGAQERRRAGANGEAEDGSGWPRRAPERQALAVMELKPPVTPVELKVRYKELVKRHHPDANGGDKASEEKLKRITEAYRILKAAFCG